MSAAPGRPKPPDELLLRYRQACAQDERRPASAVREAVRVHAAMLAHDRQTATSPPITAMQPAANQSRWKLSLLASVALVGLTSLLVLQFERGTREERELALGRSGTRNASTKPSPAPTKVAPARDLTTARSRAAAPTTAQAPAPAQVPRADALPQANLSKAVAKGDSFSKQEPVDAMPGGAARPATVSGAPAQESAPAPALAEPSGQPMRVPDAMPAPASAIGSVEEYAGGPTGASTVRRAAKAMAAPETAVAAKAESALPTLQNQRSQEAPDPHAASTKALNQRLLDNARQGQLVELEHLLDQGAQINSTDAAGRTPLMLAAINDHATTVATLLALGANSTLTDHDGLTALQHARRLGLTQIANLIEAGR